MRLPVVTWRPVTCGLVLTVLTSLAGGCASEGSRHGSPGAASTREPSAASPTASSTPTTRRHRPARTKDPRGVQCLVATPRLAERIASGTRDGMEVTTGRTVAVKSPDLEGLYFVSMQVEVSVTGRGSRRRAAHEPRRGGPPVWAISESVWRGGNGPIMAANRYARWMTSWPDAHDHAARITDTDHNVGEAGACQLI